MPFVIPARWRRCALSVVAAATVLIAGVPAAAQAAPANPDNCVAEHPLSKPFLAWGDTADYALAPGGDFEADGWELSGVAQRVRGNQPHDIGAGRGTSSLLLARGAVATSPPMCIDETYPHFRFFLRGAGDVRAEVLFLDAEGNVEARDASTVSTERDWDLSPNMLIDVPWAGTAAPVRFRFTARSGLVQVDDVYIDPWGRG